MKKRVVAVLLTLVMAISMSACGNKNNETNNGASNNAASNDATESNDNAAENENEQAETESAANEDERTQLIVGFDAEFPPYGYMDNNGEYVGFDLDLAQEVCERNGWELVKKPINWDSKDMELNSGSIDCIWNGFTMNARENDYTWTEAYVDNSIVVVVAADSEISSLANLAGKNVAVQADSSGLAALIGEDAEDAIKELTESFANLQQVADYNSAFMNLEAGAVDAVVLDIGVAKYQMNSRGEGFTMLDEQVSSEQYGIGFKLGNTSLRDKVQETLKAMVADGKFDEIVANYADYNLPDMVCLQQ